MMGHSQLGTKRSSICAWLWNFPQSVGLKGYSSQGATLSTLSEGGAQDTVYSRIQRRGQDLELA